MICKWWIFVEKIHISFSDFSTIAALRGICHGGPMEPGDVSGSPKTTLKTTADSSTKSSNIIKNPHQNTIYIDLKQAIDIGFPEGYPEHLNN
jgi:hypothetical protein